MNTLVRLHNRLNPQLAPLPDRLDDLFAGFFRPIANTAGSGLPEIRLDVHEDEKVYRVSAAIPGVKKDDIHVAVDGNEVSIEVEVKRESSEKDGERLLHSERFYGKTSRAFTLASEIDDARVEARYADGVLTLTLPKKPQTAGKRIAVN